MVPTSKTEPMIVLIYTLLAQQEPPSKASPYILFTLFGVPSFASINYPTAMLSAWNLKVALNER